MSGITGYKKGDILADAIPYIIVPLYNDLAYDPTHKAYFEDLPKLEQYCLVWNQRYDCDTTTTPKIKKFLQRYLVQRSSSLPLPPLSSVTWQLVSILATLRVINQRDQGDSSPQWSNFMQGCDLDKARRTTTDFSHPITEDDDNNNNNNNNKKDNDDDDDDDDSLLFEIWPMIQNEKERIPFVIFRKLYRRIQNRLHILTIPHPMIQWAKETIFQLSDYEYETSWKIFQKTESKRKPETKLRLSIMTTATSSSPSSPSSPSPSSPSSPPNRLYASYLWLNRIATLPERVVGILLEDPISSSAEWMSLDNDNNYNNENIQTILNISRFCQSCLPNTCLELRVIGNEHGVSKQIPFSRCLAQRETSVKIRCSWLALYDISAAELGAKNRMTLSTIPKSSNCECFRCSYEKGATAIHTFNDLSEAQRLAHSFFQEQAYEDAVKLYHQCYNFCVSSTNKRCITSDTGVVKTTTKQDTNEWLLQVEADLFYTIGAVFLSQKKFSLAQQHWKGGSRYKDMHKELSKQLTKQNKYQYFHPDYDLRHKIIFDHCSEQQQFAQNSIFSKKQQLPIFVAQNIIDIGTCRKLIQFALEHASNNGGWTNDRHYAVPTTDIPLHIVPNLLEWFNMWKTQVLFPTLSNQFISDDGGDDCDKRLRFYVHDAFLVRYEASSLNHYLPLHFDESTHSCVCSLNDDYVGGGSYVCDLNRSICPPPGGMLSFMGNECLHGGSPLSSGVRYILAIFLYLDDDLYCSEENNRKTKINESLSLSSVIDTGSKMIRPDVEIREEYNQDSKRVKTQDKKDDGFSFSFF